MPILEIELYRDLPFSLVGISYNILSAAIKDEEVRSLRDYYHGYIKFTYVYKNNLYIYYKTFKKRII